MKDAIEAWVKAHALVDPLLHAAVVVGLLAAILAGAATCLYSAWFLLRLLRLKHIRTFLNRPIPGLLKGSVGPAVLEFGEELGELVPAFERQTTEVVAKLEERISRVEAQFANWEDTFGKA